MNPRTPKGLSTFSRTEDQYSVLVRKEKLPDVKKSLSETIQIVRVLVDALRTEAKDLLKILSDHRGVAGIAPHHVGKEGILAEKEFMQEVDVSMEKARIALQLYQDDLLKRDTDPELHAEQLQRGTVLLQGLTELLSPVPASIRAHITHVQSLIDAVTMSEKALGRAADRVADELTEGHLNGAALSMAKKKQREGESRAAVGNAVRQGVSGVEIRFPALGDAGSFAELLPLMQEMFEDLKTAIPHDVPFPAVDADLWQKAMEMVAKMERAEDEKEYMQTKKKIHEHILLMIKPELEALQTATEKVRGEIDAAPLGTRVMIADSMEKHFKNREATSFRQRTVETTKQVNSWSDNYAHQIRLTHEAICELETSIEKAQKDTEEAAESLKAMQQVRHKKEDTHHQWRIARTIDKIVDLNAAVAKMDMIQRRYKLMQKALWVCAPISSAQYYWSGKKK